MKFDLRPKIDYQVQAGIVCAHIPFIKTVLWKGLKAHTREESNMGTEIERKFLVKNQSWRSRAAGVKYRQGYLNSARERTVRVRAVDDKGFLTIKSVATGATRQEYEYEIPLADAEAMLGDLCEKPLIVKARYKIHFGGRVWEVDEFFGDNRGLILAEVELAREKQKFEKPPWVGQEVTGDPRYFNSNLVRHPYGKW